jgi:hypothetical protein
VQAMIKFGVQGLSLSLPVARALLEFVSEDPKRPECSIGIDGGEVCATDGATAVRFEQSESEEGAAPPSQWNGRVFPWQYLARQLKAAGRQGPVVLDWACLSAGYFPGLGKVEPAAGIDFHDSVMFDPRLLARLEVVSKACRPERFKKEDDPPMAPGVLLTSLSSTFMAPMRWKVGGAEWVSETPHVAWVTIMPMRKNGQQKPKRARKAASSASPKPKRAKGTVAA